MNTLTSSGQTKAAPSPSGVGQSQPGREVKVVTRIAPPSASEKNSDRRAVRCRTRRERPQKLRIADNHDGDDGAAVGEAATSSSTAKRNNMMMYEPDIESFVTSCIPGVSIAPPTIPTKDDPNNNNIQPSQRRTKSIRKRSLPLLSFLSSTHLAAAEKKRKKEEQDRLNAIAQEEARKALLLNPIVKPAGMLDNDTSNIGEGGETHQHRAKKGARPTQSEVAAVPETTTAATTTTHIENTSNILMPPLLKDFLSHPKLQ